MRPSASAATKEYVVSEKVAARPSRRGVNRDTARAGKPRRARRQEVTKESHRDRRYNAAGQPLGFDKSPAPVWV